ncbi:MAG: hypothetical protein AB8B51_18080 [Sedimentitalea sp.]
MAARAAAEAGQDAVLLDDHRDLCGGMFRHPSDRRHDARQMGASINPDDLRRRKTHPDQHNSLRRP